MKRLPQITMHVCASNEEQKLQNHKKDARWVDNKSNISKTRLLIRENVRHCNTFAAVCKI